MIARGMGTDAAAAFLGHTSTAITEGHYIEPDRQSIRRRRRTWSAPCGRAAGRRPACHASYGRGRGRLAAARRTDEGSVA